MFNVVEKAYFENAIIVECEHCVNNKNPDAVLGRIELTQVLFMNKGDLLTHCVVCGCGEGDQEIIASKEIDCSYCDEKITIKQIRESAPCSTCDNVNNRVVATISYKSKDDQVVPPDDLF